MEIETLFPSGMSKADEYEINHIISFFIDRCSNLVEAIENADKIVQQRDLPYRIAVEGISVPFIVVTKPKRN